jgi:4-alpha-glucanotransferase
MNFPRASGIILHPTSLPSHFGTGDLGDEAFSFADFLAGTGTHLWQTLPLGPTGFGNSPYQSLSVFAGNPLLISPERLLEDGLLSAGDIDSIPPFPVHTVNFEAVAEYKRILLKKSGEAFRGKATRTQRDDFDRFCDENAAWLNTFALFMALREAHETRPWNTWDEDIRFRRPEAIDACSKKLATQVWDNKFQQYLFFRQWYSLKDYCNRKQIKLIGDIPIFVAFDSADVWSHPELFQLDSDGNPTVAAGVPPDYFSKTGQLWGNPIYNWQNMAKDNYGWWVERLRAAEKLVDIIRLDHFRGFVGYWEVPSGEKTAEKGHWVSGPGVSLFHTVGRALGELPVIVEDLGVITPDVDALREELGLPGMRVLQFAFSDNAKSDVYKPHNYIRNCAVYTATHDNDTTKGWFSNIDTADSTHSSQAFIKEKQNALKYTGTDGREINWDFIRLAWMSVADTAIAPLQDILGLGSEARMNRPGIAKGNWGWRFTADMLNPELEARLKELNVVYGRSKDVVAD